MPDLTGKEKAGAIIAAACLVCAPLTAAFEGYVPKAAPDPAQIPTYCYGETENVDPERVYTKDECGALLRKRLAHDYAPKIAQCLPEVATEQRVRVFAALLDASYNAGWNAVCQSRMAVAIHAGNIAQGCKLLEGWYVTARNRKTGVRVTLPGLVKRRKAESQLCLS